ncbi:MAG: hypothetical protein Q9166_006486 [cf. Caloplaca sp. 2 TL-2023]
MDSLRPPRRQIPLDLKAKGRAEDGELVASKRTPTSRHRQKQSIGSSPLSTVVYSSTEKPGSQSFHSHRTDEILPIPRESTLQSHADRNGSTVIGQDSRDEAERSAGEVRSAIGHNTDPAQIVNLALSLSESRRRNVSGGGLSPVYVNGSRRQMSSEQSAGRLSGSYGSTGGAKLRRHLNEQRRISRNFSPISSTQSTESPSPRSARSTEGSDVSAQPRYFDSGASPEVVLNPSSATLARAERARIAFELSYEYRRLLQYLPRLPAASHSKPSTAKAASSSEASAADLGRVYDPLQYIRNRKVRGRERKHLDAEAEGWKDLNRVKLWVDTIANDREDTSSLPDDRTALPPLDTGPIDPQAVKASPDHDGLSRPIKSEGQSLDWSFTPWDLLADAAWLSRDDNMRLIEDTKGTKILPQKKQSKENTPKTSLEKARGPVRRSLSLVRQGLADERRSLELNTPKKKDRARSHSRGKSYEPKTSLGGYESPRDRKGRWHSHFVRSRSASSSEGSMTDGVNGYAWGNYRDRDGLDSAALEKQMMKLLAQEIQEDPYSNPRILEPAKAKPIEDGLDQRKEQQTIKPKVNLAQKQASSPDRGKPTISSARSQRPSKSSLEEQRGRQPRTSLDNLNDTAPNSPSTFQFGPSIFVNRSAPNSRSVSPKKPLPSRFRPSLRTSSKSRRTVSEYNVDAVTQSPTKARLLRTKDANNGDPQQAIQKSDSASNLLSPITAELFGKRFRRMNNSSASIKAAKESRDPDSRFRGLLKGTRIAELVGNEVSRFGDIIWRRDAGNPLQTNSPVTARARDNSDTEGENSTMENSPETDLSRVTTTTDDGGSLSRMFTKGSQPRYHHPNLPMFRSSISQASPGSPKVSSAEDHPITRQQLAQKVRGRSSRFERLAPPRIDMRNVSPSASPPRSRTQETNITISRDNSTLRSDHRVRSADRRLNDVLGIPGTVRNVVAPTGLANLSSKTSNHPGMGDRQWSISDRSVSNTRTGTVTKRDIARVRALLLSSGIKANEIARQANTVDDPPFVPQLREIHQRWGDKSKSIPRVPRAQEHLLTAKLIVQEIDSTNQRLRDAAEVYSSQTVEDLHQQFKDLDAYISNNLVPAVRGSADDADNLSTELTTTHTLAVKRVNDAVELVWRRRRRRFRSKPQVYDMQDKSVDKDKHDLAVVYRRLSGKATLEPIAFDSSDTGQRVFEKVKAKQQDLSRTESQLWVFKLLITKWETAIAEIKWALTALEDTDDSGMRVDIKGFERDNLFSEALRHPGLLANEPDFITENRSLVLDKPDRIHGYAGQQVLVVYAVADKEKIAWLLLLSLILSPALGVIVGRFSHRADKSDTEPKASIQDSDAIVFPGSHSRTAKGPTPPAPGAIPPTSATAASPATPISEAVVPPQNVPLVPPQPPGGKLQTAPPTSIPPTAKRDNGPITPKAPSTSDAPAPPPPPPPPSPPNPKPKRFRRFLITLIFLSAFGFAGGTYYSLVSDNFHDFFTEYVPFGEDAVLYFEEREFRRRFPSMTNPTNRPSPSGSTVTIPSKSGLSWKISEEDQKGSDLEKKGRHLSALDGNEPKSAKENAQRTPSVATGSEKVQAVEQLKKDGSPSSTKSESSTKSTDKESSPPPAEKPEKAAPTPAPAPAPSPPPAPKSEANSKDSAVRSPEVNEPNRIMPTPRIDPLSIPNADQPVVQDLVKIINDIIAVVNADNAQGKYQSAISKAKSELAGVGSKIMALEQAEKIAAEDKIKATQTEFENAAKELVRRLEEEMRNQTASYRDEFESERERVSKHYQDRLDVEIKRAQELSDQRLRNELLEQAVSLKQKFISEVQQQVETERSGRLSKLSSLSSSIEELESLTSSWNKVIDTNLQTQHLLLAVEAVRSTLENADRPRPFISELATLKELATSDSVISSAIASINPTAYQRGIPTRSQLIDRFRRVASEVRKASLLPEEAGVASHAASYVLSRVMFKKQGMTIGDDVESVLTRTETLLEEGRLDEAAREMNCLGGWAKSLSADWLGDVRKVLEVRQAVDVMGTEARLLGLGVE